MTNQMEELFMDLPEGGGGERRREGEALARLPELAEIKRRQGKKVEGARRLTNQEPWGCF